MYSNNKLILQLLALMKAHQISKVVVSPGSRHFPIIHSMEKDPYFDMYSVVDERSAAFFALGLIQKFNEPVAICCTSGTSTINYGSAVVEAHYQQLPLLLLTADRLPELLGQMEEQMFKQDDVFRSFVKFNGKLKEVNDKISEWYCNRIINEGLLALNHGGKGPVHLNFPIEKHNLDTFETTNLPKVRKISKTYAYDSEAVWGRLAAKLQNKKVLIVWGQNNPMSEALRASLNQFTEHYNTAIFCDQLGNCHHERAIGNAFTVLMNFSVDEKEAVAPDIVITLFANYVFNGLIKNYLIQVPGFEHWDVVPSGMVRDPFKCLTEIFEMDEQYFFSKLGSYGNDGASSYFDHLKTISDRIEEPKVEYSELYAIGELMRALPKNVSLHIANSAPSRMAMLFDFDPSIKVYCNRGVNGIDGCMSTAVGYASRAEELVFLVIGDLTFFYDMNALWNRHLSKNIRILLLNNEGGAVMHMPLKERFASILPKHVSAGHNTSARGWVESLGITYLEASNQIECDIAMNTFTDINTDGPVLLEVFTKKESDIKILKQYYESLNKTTFLDKAKRKIARKLGI